MQTSSEARTKWVVTTNQKEPNTSNVSREKSNAQHGKSKEGTGSKLSKAAGGQTSGGLIIDESQLFDSKLFEKIKEDIRKPETTDSFNNIEPNADI